MIFSTDRRSLVIFVYLFLFYFDFLLLYSIALRRWTLMAILIVLQIVDSTRIQQPTDFEASTWTGAANNFRGLHDQEGLFLLSKFSMKIKYFVPFIWYEFDLFIIILLQKPTQERDVMEEVHKTHEAIQ